MDRRITVLGLLLLASGLGTGCAVETAPKVILPVTGSPITPEWAEYNKQAEIKGAPLLMYAVTAKELSQTTKPEEPRQIQDTFSLEDERLYVYTRWSNVHAKPRYEVKFYDPRGSLFLEWDRAYTFATGIWNVWTFLRIKGWPATRLPGKWRAEIFMDDSLALRNEFVIGSETHRYEQTVLRADAPTIGVHPYFIDAETSGRENSTLLPLYISQMLMVDFDKYRVVTPFQLRREIGRPVAKYAAYGSVIREELRSPYSQWISVAQKYKMDLLIAGAVHDPATLGEQKEATVYLISTRTREAKEIKAFYTSRRAFDRTGGEVIANFYQEIYNQIVKQGAEALKIR